MQDHPFPSLTYIPSLPLCLFLPLPLSLITVPWTVSRVCLLPNLLPFRPLSLLGMCTHTLPLGKVFNPVLKLVFENYPFSHSPFPPHLHASHSSYNHVPTYVRTYSTVYTVCGSSGLLHCMLLVCMHVMYKIYVCMYVRICSLGLSLLVVRNTVWWWWWWGMYVCLHVCVHVCVCLPPQDGSNDSACQLLRNLCSLKVFLESSLACRDMPDVYYTEPGDLLLTQNVITSQFVTRGSSLVCVAWSAQSTIHTLGLGLGLVCSVHHRYKIHLQKTEGGDRVTCMILLCLRGLLYGIAAQWNLFRKMHS